MLYSNLSVLFGFIQFKQRNYLISSLVTYILSA